MSKLINHIRLCRQIITSCLIVQEEGFTQIVTMLYEVCVHMER